MGGAIAPMAPPWIRHCQVLTYKLQTAKHWPVLRVAAHFDFAFVSIWFVSDVTPNYLSLCVCQSLLLYLHLSYFIRQLCRLSVCMSVYMTHYTVVSSKSSSLSWLTMCVSLRLFAHLFVCLLYSFAVYTIMNSDQMTLNNSHWPQMISSVQSVT